MEISNRENKQELFERPRSIFNRSPNEVFVIKEVFPNGAIGRMLLNSAYEMVEVDGHVLDRIKVADKNEVIGKSFFNLFATKEKMRLDYFFKHVKLETLSVLSLLQLRKTRKVDSWVSIYAKQQHLENADEGYAVVFLNSEDSFGTLTTDKFDTLYRSFYEMYETELSQIGLTLRDDLAQELYALRVSLQNFILEHGYESEISLLKKRLNNTIKKVTDLSNDLLPNVFLSVGFLAAMEDMVFFVKRLGYDLLYKVDARILDKSPEFQFCCYRIVQALLQSWKQNVAPYEASLRILVKGNRVVIRLIESRKEGGEGVHDYSDTLLHNLRNRIALYNGSLEINRILENSQVLITMYN